MMTLREFVEVVNAYTHFRVYQPNRDCLIYESYFTIHSPYFFDKKHEEDHDWYNDAYYQDNLFCDNVRFNRDLDEETKIFLEKFGNCEVFNIEIGGFRPSNIRMGKDGKPYLESIGEDPLRPGHEIIDCFNIFII